MRRYKNSLTIRVPKQPVFDFERDQVCFIVKSARDFKKKLLTCTSLEPQNGFHPHLIAVEFGTCDVQNKDGVVGVL
jgi:hypothetical protein